MERPISLRLCKVYYSTASADFGSNIAVPYLILIERISYSFQNGIEIHDRIRYCFLKRHMSVSTEDYHLNITQKDGRKHKGLQNIIVK